MPCLRTAKNGPLLPSRNDDRTANIGDQCPDYELVRMAHLGNIEYAQDCVEQLYAGELADFAQYTTVETTEVPENLQF